jgi:hypothetical protein
MAEAAGHEELYSEDLYNVYASPNIFEGVWDGEACGCHGGESGSFIQIFSAANLKELYYLWDSEVDVRRMLKWILQV